MLSQFMGNPHEIHWKDANRFIQYLQWAIEYGMEYNNRLNIELMGSDWVGDQDDRKSTTFYAFNIGFGILK